jgi:hypothetical protein
MGGCQVEIPTLLLLNLYAQGEMDEFLYLQL